MCPFDSGSSPLRHTPDGLNTQTRLRSGPWNKGALRRGAEVSGPPLSPKMEPVKYSLTRKTQTSTKSSGLLVESLYDITTIGDSKWFVRTPVRDTTYVITRSGTT